MRALLCGDSGIGKTTSLGTLPPGQTIIAAAERGLLPLRGKGFRVLAIESWEDVRELVRIFSRAEIDAQGRLTLDVGGELIPGINILAIDSLTELCALAIRQIVDVDRRALISDRTKGKTERPQGIYEDLMGMEDWNLFGNRMRQLLGMLTKIPCHLIMTSLMEHKENKQTGAIEKVPLVNGKLAFEVISWFDLVLSMEPARDPEGNIGRIWRTASDGIVKAKDSTGILDVFEPTNWTVVMKKIFANKTAASQAA